MSTGIFTPAQWTEVQALMRAEYAKGHLQGMMDMVQEPGAAENLRASAKRFAATFHEFLTKYGNLVPSEDVRDALEVLDRLGQKL